MSHVNGTVIFNRPLRYGSLGCLSLIVSYSLTFLLGFFGNLAVIWVVGRNTNLWSRTNQFIASLAVADLLVSIICVPFSLWSHLFEEWIFGSFTCKLVAYCQGVSVTASVYILIGLTVDRCMAVACPLAQHFSIRGSLISIWAFAVALNLPWFFVFDVVRAESLAGDTIEMCVEEWPSQRMGNIYFGVVSLTLCYVGPLSVITMCCIIIWRSVTNRKILGEDLLQRQSMRKRKNRTRVTKMVLVVVITFFLSWLPLYVIFCFVKFSELFDTSLPPRPEALAKLSSVEQFIHIALPIAQFLGASNASFNPILYAFMNEKFRSGFKMLFGCLNGGSGCHGKYGAAGGPSYQLKSEASFAPSDTRLMDLSSSLGHESHRLVANSTLIDLNVPDLSQISDCPCIGGGVSSSSSSSSSSNGCVNSRRDSRGSRRRSSSISIGQHHPVVV